MNDTVNDDVNQSDKEDEDDDNVVQDVRCSLARLLVDVHPSDYEEEDADNQLWIEFQNPFHKGQCRDGKMISFSRPLTSDRVLKFYFEYISYIFGWLL